MNNIDPIPVNQHGKLLITAPEAAQILSLSIPTIRRRMRDGSIPTIRISGSVRIPLKALNQMIEEQTA